MATPRWPVVLATLISLPTFALCVGASASIAWSIATDPGYRNLFLGYGVRMLVLEASWALGIVAAAAIAGFSAWRDARIARTLAFAIAGIGFVAALILERQFWAEADAWFPRGAFAVPYLAWLACAAFTRRPAASR
jgi:hypothetical protein